jgi:hypothetical protein
MPLKETEDILEESNENWSYSYTSNVASTIEEITDTHRLIHK